MIKKIIFLLLGIIFVPAITLGAVQSVGNGQEKILSYQNKSELTPSGKLISEERIIYDFGSNKKHGIFRNFPTVYKPRKGNPHQEVNIISVTDETGESQPVTTSGLNILTAQIGDENKLVTGVKTYIIKYEVDRVINSVNGSDQFYWNFIGDGWNVPIEKASIFLNLPKSFEGKEITSVCYKGAFADASECLLSSYSKNIIQKEIIYNQNNLNPHEAMTIKIEFPKNYFPVVSAWEIFIWESPWYLGVPIISLIIFFFWWYVKGRDPRGRGTIVPQYEAPKEIEPAEAFIINRGALDNKGLTAQIIYLASAGYIKIKRIEEKKLIGKKVDYELEKIQESSQNIKIFNQKIMLALFKEGSTIKLSDLDNNFASDYRQIKKQIFRSVIDAGYYRSNPVVIKVVYLVISLVILLAGIGIASYMVFSAVGYISFILPGLFLAAFAFIMPIKTVKGSLMKEYLLGLREFIKVAEADRIKFHNAPKKNPAKFEELLPYAMIFGLEKEWAQQFEDIYKNPPDWYVGNYAAFSVVAFTDSLHEFSANTSSTFTSVSSSGGGGGGFSGGGGGGGGGGSW